MKKIVHVITGLNDGGAEAVLYRLCANDVEVEHCVVSLMDKGKYGSLLEKKSIAVFCLDMPAGRVTLSGLRKLYKLLNSLKPDVVQTWMYHADLIGGGIARLAGIRNVFWGVHHTTLIKGESKTSTILVAKLNAFLSKFIPKKIIYCAEKAREIQETLGFEKSKGIVVNNGYEIDRFVINNESRETFRNELDVGFDEFLVGHVGRFDPQKDHKNLLDALAITKSTGVTFKSALIGTQLDRDNSKLVSLVQDHELTSQVSLLGRRSNIPAVMNGFDLFVLSSFSEAFPNVLNEAMACGTPCVTTDVGDAAVIVGNTGWVVPSNNPQALADAILVAIDEKTNNVEAWCERKKQCRNRIVENFSIDKMIESYHTVWERL